MSELSVVRTRFTVPFRIKDSYYDVVKDLSKSGGLWESAVGNDDGRIEQDIFESVRGLITDCSDTDFNIGRRFKYRSPENGTVLKCVYHSPKNDRIEFDISDAGVMVFKSDIGFLWYEVSLTNIGTDEFTMFINEFKELSYKRLSAADKFRNNAIPLSYIDDENRQKGLLTGHWINAVLLKDIKDRIAYFSNRECYIDGSLIPDKAVIFNYAVCPAENASDSIDPFIYHTTNGFNLKYKAPKNFADMCFKPFENVTCYMTTNGCSYFGIYDDSNKSFFTRTMKEKIMQDYYLMFILVLHQYFGILNFNLCINSTCPFCAVDKNGSDNEAEFLDILDRLSSGINIFVTKSFFPSVSHIYHQNEFYYYLQERTGIKRNLENLTIGLDSMRNMQAGFIRQREDELEKEENSRRSRADEKISIAFSLLSILTIVSAITDGDAAMDILAKFFGMSEKAVAVSKLAAFVILVVISAVVIAAAAFSVINYLRSYKNKK